MVERTHRTLKAALMARCTGPNWRAQLPWVLLGIRTSPKEELRVSPAEMVFGEPLVVPGEFFPSFYTTDDGNYLARLRQAVGKYRPCVQTHKKMPPQQRESLIAGHSDWVSIDRLKPAYLEEEESTSTSPFVDGHTSMSDHSCAPPPTPVSADRPRLASSRAGRLIRQPEKLDL
ncbi:uncharacterized protein LOC123519780 [Portunus trituberculatus]|uniref:uncharacterized protein LOC123519780 n=1 Tax=Portunus trituberculatus TaxID=210409 RepID=UPI001E1CE5C9|nr:uncharacterized protein LOC123519780 [Portunus trituberculatus]